MMPRPHKALLALGAVIAALVAWWLARRMHVPAFAGFSARLLGQPAPILSLLCAYLIAAVCVCIGVLVCAPVRYDAPLFCAAVGVAVLSMRGGPMSSALLSAIGPRVYLWLAVETVLLFAVVLLARGVQHALRGRLLRPEQDYDHLATHRGSLPEGLKATGIGALVMAAVGLILIQSDDKAQVMIGVGAGAMLASAVARRVVPVSPVTWFAAIPFVVALVGYLGTYVLDPSGWSIGVCRGMLAPLARPLPLDYASVGVACAVWGYWLGRHGELVRLATELDEQSAT